GEEPGARSPSQADSGIAGRVMMATLAACPAPDRLLGLLEGFLSDAEQVELTAHLDVCVTCRERLDRIATDGESWSAVPRNLKAAPSLSETPSEHIIEKIKASGSETATHAGQERNDDPSLSFLRPPETPGHLGRLGNFEILEVVGRGGMGIVFKAFDE